MKKIILIITVSLSLFAKSQTWNTEEQYIQKFAPYAVEEMEKYKIPASITLAQGLLETSGGQSILAQQGKNHFGIKCKEDWTGRTMKHTDDAPNECFRVYDDVKQSYEDHSKFLATRKYYVNLFKLDMKDYKAWAHGLKKAGYATNSRYAYILIDKIEKYKLYEFDNTDSKQVYYAILKLFPDLNKDSGFMAQIDGKKDTVQKEQVSYSPPPPPPAILKERGKTNSELLNSILVKNHPNEGLKFIIIPAETNVEFISKKFGVSESKIIKWNELEGSKLKKNQIVFLESKNSSGNIDTYKAVAGETMQDIAQKFAVKLKKLYSKNRMNFGEQPKPGQLIYLQSKKPRS